MTRKEIAEVRRAIRELMADEPLFEVAIGRLAKLVGWRYPASELGGRPVPLRDLFKEAP